MKTRPSAGEMAAARAGIMMRDAKISDVAHTPRQMAKMSMRKQKVLWSFEERLSSVF